MDLDKKKCRHRVSAPVLNCLSGLLIMVHGGGVGARTPVLIGGTQYAGEIKKSIFTVMNYPLPQLSGCCSRSLS